MNDRHPGAPRRDLYADVTAKIIAAIESGAASYSFPWHTVPGPPKNIVSGRAYRGVNTLLLWLTGQAKGYPTPHWATFKQWLELGHPVRKGEKATTVVFWKQTTAAANDNGSSGGDGTDGENGTRRARFLARAYFVFNGAQVQDYAPPIGSFLDDADRDAVAEAFFAHLPITVSHDACSAFYSPAVDTVNLPPFRLFKDANAYYATRAHESVHATGAKHRLDRDLSGRFGTQAYAGEELVAELGAAFLCADLRLTPEPRPDHAGYIQSWLKALKDDPRAIFTAAGKAQAAVDWLHGQQPGDRSAPSSDPDDLQLNQ